MSAPLSTKSRASTAGRRADEAPGVSRYLVDAVRDTVRDTIRRTTPTVLLALAFHIVVSAAPANARPAGELGGSSGASLDALQPAPHPLQRHDGLRCGDRLVELGERTAEVLVKCGAPLTRDRWTETRQRGKEILLVNVEEWVYGADYGSFRRLLRFENGRLLSVEALRR